MEKIFHYNLAGKDLIVTIGKVAEQAGGHVLYSMVILLL